VEVGIGRAWRAAFRTIHDEDHVDVVNDPVHNPPPMADKADLVHVEIFGQTYSVKAGGDPGYVEKLAASVDEQMKDVSRASGAVDSLRVAVLAALNLADECVRLRRDVDEARRQSLAAGTTADDRIARLARKLGSALGE
jgi:cell division protein ZapA